MTDTPPPSEPMTDNPSSSVPVSKEPTKGQEIAYRWLKKYAIAVFHTEQLVLAAAIDSALASQEARHQKDLLAKDAEWIDRARRYFDIGSGIELAKALNEHYAPGSVLADVVMHEVWKRNPDVEALAAQVHRLQEAEARHRQEMEEAKREVDCEGSVNGPCTLPPSRGIGRYCWMHAILRDQRRYVDAESKLRAAEQREREAGEALQGMLDYADDDGIRGALTMAAIHGYHGTPEGRALNQVRVANAKAALAAIRPAPSPDSQGNSMIGSDSLVSGPKLKDPAAPSPVSAPSTDPPCKCGRSKVSISHDRSTIAARVFYLHDYEPASPVEPGSDPKEPETR